jgi:hypothetical protein
MKKNFFDLSYTANDLRLKSHWITFSIFISLIPGLLLTAWSPIAGILCILILALLMIGLGTLFSSVSHKIYTIVRKITVRLRSLMSGIILFVIYYGFIWPMSFTGSKLKKDDYEKAKTGWQSTQSRSKEKNLYSSGSLFKWIYKSGDWWLIFIYPWLLLLKLYGSDDTGRSVPEDTYTLY